MKRFILGLFAAITMVATGCEGFDDSAIWDKLNSLEGRVKALEQLCSQMNTNISALQTIVEALQNNDYVTNIAPIKEGDKIIGYTISFNKSDSITIYHGKDGKNGENGKDGVNGTNGTNGKDGHTPQIGVKKDVDGIYYWVLDGEWLLDDEGNKIKAEGRDGKDGEDGEDGVNGTNGTNGTNGKNGNDGITPKLKIENGYWYVSYDNGATWSEVGKATGEDGEDGNDGDSMFEDITYDDDYVYITLADGTTLVLPRSVNSNEIPNNEIWYTTTNGSAITLTEPNAFGAKIISNVYEKSGRGIITFDGDVTSIGEEAFYRCFSLI